MLAAKHSSLFCFNISNGEKQFRNICTRRSSWTWPRNKAMRWGKNCPGMIAIKQFVFMFDSWQTCRKTNRLMIPSLRVRIRNAVGNKRKSNCININPRRTRKFKTFLKKKSFNSKHFSPPGWKTKTSRWLSRLRRWPLRPKDRGEARARHTETEPRSKRFQCYKAYSFFYFAATAI